MSQAGDTSAEQGSKQSWRGHRGAHRRTARHRWQDDWAAQPLKRLQSRERWRRVRIGLLLVMFLLLVGAFVWYLLFAPSRTPLLAMSATTYAYPFPPNAWAREDLDGLLSLDKEILSVEDASALWQTKERGLRALDRQLPDLVRAGERSGCVILYVSMHGAIDGAGNPCLVPPGASPQRSETWLPVSELLRHIKQAPADINKLLIFDCSRLSSNWDMGLLYNGFSDQLARAIEEANVPNLAVINSTAAGQKGWSSPDLGASVLGHFLRLALAGEADEISEGGNGNRQVSLHELHRYLSEHTNGWTRQNRDASQQPLLLPLGAKDFPVCWTLRRYSQRNLIGSTNAVRGQPNVSDEDRNTLWQQHESINAISPERYDPLTWRDFQQRLLWLESAANAGAVYLEPARTLLADLQTETAQIERRISGLETQDDYFSRGAIMTGLSLRPDEPLPVHSLPMSRRFGALDLPTIDHCQSALSRLFGAPSDAALQETITALKTAAPDVKLADTQFLEMLARYQTPAIWQQPDTVTRTADALRRSEAIAAPQDERAQYWVAAMLARSDALRRLAADRLLAGDAASLQRAATQLDQVHTQAEQAEIATRAIEQALAVNDRVWSQLPYLARWVMESRAPDPTEREDALRKLIDDCHVLAGRLAAPRLEGPGGEASVQPVEEQARRVEQHYNLLTQQINADYETITNETTQSAATLPRVEALLQLPLLTLQQRQRLRNIDVQISGRLSDTWRQSASDTRRARSHSQLNDASDPDESSELGNLLRTWPVHPALLILNAEKPLTDAPVSAANAGPAAAAPNMLQVIAMQGRRVREHLVNIPEVCQQTLEPDLAENLGAAQGAKTTDRQRLANGLTHTQQLVRAASGFWFPSVDQDPVGQMRRYDLQQLFLWHSERSLEEMLGPVTPSQQPMFVLSATNYRQDAANIWPANPAAEQQLAAIDTKLARRQDWVANGLKLAASDILLVEGLDNASTKIVIHANASERADAPLTGDATVMLRGNQGRIPNTAREISLASAETSQREIEYTLPVGVLEKAGPVLQAVTMFRGTEFTTPVVLDTAGGAEVIYTPAVYNTSQITVTGTQRRQAALMFILDCSASMSETMSVEAPGSDRKAPRLEIAKNALNRMGDMLAQQGGANVGVRFYGHRVGWNTKDPDQLLRQTDYARRIPEDLLPSEDVELVLPLGRFDTIAAGQVADLMKTVKPWGETPLYLSLIEALNDFTPADDDSERSIIVITDGLNYQFNSPDPKGRQDLVTAWQQQKIPIHIVGFGISDQQAEQAEREFTSLAQLTGGSYVSATHATELIQSLERLLRKAHFQVLDSTGRKVADALIGKAVEIAAPARAQEFDVVMQKLSQHVQLVGGEALEFSVGPDGRSLLVPEFTQGDPTFTDLVSGTPPVESGYQLGVHRPVRSEDGTEFTFSIQQANRHFTPRPVEIWFQVTPQTSAGKSAGPDYTFYSSEFQPGRSVPVVAWKAYQWPDEATQAAVRCWTRFARTEPTSTVTVGEVAGVLPMAGQGAALEPIPGLRYQVRAREGASAADPYRVAVVVRYLDSALPMPAIKVEMQPLANKVTHRYDAVHRVSTHLFDITADDLASVQRHELQFTARTAIEAGALELSKPIIVPIAGQGDLLRLAPASGD